MTGKIKQVRAQTILDSRGWPTVEATVILDSGEEAAASVPSPLFRVAETMQEARDGQENIFFGQGVSRAIDFINLEIEPAVRGLVVSDQVAIDNRLRTFDETPTLEKIGINTILPVSLAVARAASVAANQELYVYLNEAFFGKEPVSLPAPIFTCFNGGISADTNLDFQAFLTVPNLQAPIFIKAERPFFRMLRAGVETYKALAAILREAGYDSDTGLEGGYAPDMDSSLQALELIMAATLKAGYDPHREINLGIDIGSALLYDPERRQYIFSLDGQHFSANFISDIYADWLKRYPVVYLEDPAARTDEVSWKKMNEELGGQIILAGDELFADSVVALRRALPQNLANAVVVTLGKAGTLTETLEYLKLAKRHNYRIIASQRNAETNDDFIADLAVAAGVDYFKGGAPARGERVAKWNRLLKIENWLYGND